jgi:hypothetical protein
MGMIKTIFGADTSRLDKGLDRAKNRVGKFSKNVSRSLGAAFSVAAIGFFFRKMTQDLDRIGKLAARGFSTDFVQDLAQAAELAGSDIEALLPKIVMLFREVNKGGTPSKEFTDNLEAIGLSITDLKGLSPEELFKSLVTGMQGTSDKATASAAAMVLLRDRGGELNTVLQGLATNGLPASARASAESIKAAENFNDSMTVLGRELTSVTAPALVWLTKAFGWLRMSVEIAGTVIGARLAKTIHDLQAAKDLLVALVKFDFKGMTDAGNMAENNFKVMFDVIAEGSKDAKDKYDELIKSMETPPVIPPITQSIISDEEDTGKQGKITKSTIADSMQRIGGGGRSVVAAQRDESIRIAQSQLEVQRRIATALENQEQEKMR